MRSEAGVPDVDPSRVGVGVRLFRLVSIAQMGPVSAILSYAITCTEIGEQIVTEPEEDVGRFP